MEFGDLAHDREAETDAGDSLAGVGGPVEAGEDAIDLWDWDARAGVHDIDEELVRMTHTSVPAGLNLMALESRLVMARCI